MKRSVQFSAPFESQVIELEQEIDGYRQRERARDVLSRLSRAELRIIATWRRWGALASLGGNAVALKKTSSRLRARLRDAWPRSDCRGSQVVVFDRRALSPCGPGIAGRDCARSLRPLTSGAYLLGGSAPAIVNVLTRERQAIGTSERFAWSSGIGPEGRRLAIGRVGGEVELYDETRALITVVETGHAPEHVGLTETELVTATRRSLIGWSIEGDGRLLWLIDRGPSIEAVSVGCRTVAVCYEDGVVLLYDTATGKAVGGLHLNGAVTSLAVDGHNNQLAAGYFDGSVLVYRRWDDESSKICCRSQEASIESVAFSNDGRSLVTASEDGTIALLDVPSGQICCRTCAHPWPARAAGFLGSECVVAAFERPLWGRSHSISLGPPQGARFRARLLAA